MLVRFVQQYITWCQKSEVQMQINISDGYNLTLSRAQLSECTPEINGLECVSMLSFVSVSNQKYTELMEHPQEDLSCLLQTIQSGWPECRRDAPVPVQPYWDSRSQLVSSDGLIYKGLCIVVSPTGAHAETHSPVSFGDSEKQTAST